VQVGEKERDHDLTSLRKEIATLVAEKCVDPSNQRPYPVGMIEKAMAEAGFSIKQNKNAKSQVNRHLESPSSALSDQHSFRYLNASSSSKLIPNCLSKELACESR
jgi:ribosome maturation protein Sdo1